MIKPIDVIIHELGQDFKTYVLKTYRVVWHVLSDAILQEAVEDYTKQKQG
jgi:hypothetical protein